MAEGNVPFPTWTVFQLLNNGNYRTRYDDTIKESKILSKLAANTYTIY